METCPKCQSDDTDVGFGLAGGGYGAYCYCNRCGNVFNKTEEVMTKIIASGFYKHDEIKRVAQMCHEANRGYCIALGDYSQKPWESAEEWQKASAYNGVVFNLDNPHAPASASHENWLKEKLEAGWAYGPVKDEAAKLHPCCVPYNDLPQEQKVKDAIFKAIVNNALPTYVDIGSEQYDVQIHYKNHRGEIGIRLIRPEDIFFGSTQWHPEPQWIINAYDYGKEARRSFAISDIAFWTFPAPPRAETAAK